MPEVADESVIVTTEDYERLSRILASVSSKTSSVLAETLAQASLVEPDDFPRDAVRLGSTIRFSDEATGREIQIAVVAPEMSDPANGNISVLAPTAIALLGKRVGSTVPWPTPRGRSLLLKIVSVSQPASDATWYWPL